MKKIMISFLVLAIFSTIAFASNDFGLDAKEMAEIAKSIKQQSTSTMQQQTYGKGVGVDTIINAVSTFAANKGNINSLVGDPKNSAPSHALAVASVNNATFTFYRKLAANDKNVFFSPYSISTALAMLYAGARGDTASQIAKLFSFTPKTHASFNSLINQINAISPSIAKIHTANALWPAADKNILSDYKKIISENYMGEIKSLDYANPRAAANTVNSWIAAKTNGKIKDMVSPFVFSKDTPLTLTNAIYFKSEWQSKFESHFTAKAMFTLRNGKNVKTDFMTQTGYFDYLKTPDLEIAELPYKSERLSMYIILPAKDKLDTIERTLSSQMLDDLITKTSNTNVFLSVTIPKFKMETEYDLDSTLKQLGLAELYTDKANFSGIDGLLDIALGKALHKTYLDVNEQGTEAAAATFIGMKSLAMRDEPKVFKANRPFIFIIRDNTTGANLFIGRYSRP